MLGVLRVLVCIMSLYTCDAAVDSRSRRVDCAYEVWSKWSPIEQGQVEMRTRSIIRHDKNGGKPCTGKLEEYRNVKAQLPVGPEEFIGNLLAGNAPSYNLAGGGRYTLSRDILLVLDNTVDVVIFPYYKSFISNIVGNICGDIGARRHDTRMHVAYLERDAVQIHTFKDDQNREVIMDEILRIPRSPDSSANLKSGIDFAHLVLTNEQSGIRRYNNATKEVFFVTSERGCGEGLQYSADQLKAAAVVNVIVLANAANKKSCLQNLASSPVESHFLRLEGITEISEQSRVLLALSPVNNFCYQSSSSSINQ